jgi:hypothetical protein
MTRFAFIGVALAGLALAGCANQAAVTSAANKAVAAAPTAAAGVQAYTTLNAALLNQIAAANPNNATVQTVVKRLLVGNAATATDAQTLAAAAPLAGIAINAAEFVGQTVAAGLAQK